MTGPSTAAVSGIVHTGRAFRLRALMEPDVSPSLHEPRFSSPEPVGADYVALMLSETCCQSKCPVAATGKEALVFIVPEFFERVRRVWARGTSLTGGYVKDAARAARAEVVPARVWVQEQVELRTRASEETNQRKTKEGSAV